MLFLPSTGAAMTTDANTCKMRCPRCQQTDTYAVTSDPVICWPCSDQHDPVPTVMEPVIEPTEEQTSFAHAWCKRPWVGYFGDDLAQCIAEREHALRVELHGEFAKEAKEVTAAVIMQMERDRIENDKLRNDLSVAQARIAELEFDLNCTAGASAEFERACEHHVARIAELERVRCPPVVDLLSNPDLLEILAHIEHARWSDWESYREKCVEQVRRPGDTEAHVERWRRQRTTPYASLSEREKESDRVEARKTVAAILSFVEDMK